jgi:hypothetical protein
MVTSSQRRHRGARPLGARAVALAVIALLGAALLAGCGEADTGDTMSASEPDPTEASPLPVEPEGGIGDGAGPPSEGEQLVGTLGGNAELEGGCAWVEAGGTRYEVRYPSGYEVRFEPLQLLGPDGEVVAEEGDEVTVTGAVDAEMMSFCQVGEIFVATAVDG